MKRYSSAASLALAVVVVLGLAGPVAGGGQVPFKGSLEGVTTITRIDSLFLSAQKETQGEMKNEKSVEKHVN